MVGMQLFQTGTCNMRINLRRRQITVTQQHLHYPQIGTMVEQVGGKGVPQGMRRQIAFYTGLCRVALDNVPKRLPRHAVTPAGRKQVFGMTFQQYLPTGSGTEPLYPVQGCEGQAAARPSENSEADVCA